MGGVACLDMGVADGRFDVRACITASGCALPFCPVIRAQEMFFHDGIENYIAVENRKPLEACAVIWPVAEPEDAALPIAGKRWRYSFAGGLLSVLLHLSVGAFAIGFLPAMLDLPAGSEVPVLVETIDEAAFAALQEGTTTTKGADILNPPLPEPVDPAAVQEALANEAIRTAAPAPDADTPVPELSANLTLPTAKPVEEEKPRQRIERKEKPLKSKVRKETVATRGSEAGNKAPGKQEGGADAVSTAAAVRGKAAKAEGMGGMAANANLRSKIIAHLGRHKRYPDAAVTMRLEGSVGVTFSIAADGSLKSAAVNHSSGHGLLDREALSMLRRAQPFPVPSGEGSGQGITITTQIGYIYPR